MKVGQVSEVKLFDKPPSKKVGKGLDEAVAVADVLEVSDVLVVDDVAAFVLVDEAPSSVVELFSVVEVAVDIVISKVVVTESSVVALLRRACSFGCNMVRTAPSMYGSRVSNRSCPSSSSKIGGGVCFGFRYHRSSSGASSRSATAAGSGSSSTTDATATDASEITRPSVVAHRTRVGCFDVAGVNPKLTEEAWCWSSR